MATFSGRLIQRMTELRLKQVDVATRVNVSKAAVSGWIKGTANEPRGDNLTKLAGVLRCSPKWLLFGDDEDSPINGATLESDAILSDRDIMLPVFKESDLTSGIGGTEVIESHSDKVRFALSVLSKQGVSAESASCCFLEGDSMDPVLPDGSLVGIDTSQTNIVDGKLYCIDYAGMLRVKQLYRVPDGIKIRSINREYEDVYVTGNFMESLRVIGKIFWSASFHS